MNESIVKEKSDKLKIEFSDAELKLLRESLLDTLYPLSISTE